MIPKKARGHRPRLQRLAEALSTLSSQRGTGSALARTFAAIAMPDYDGAMVPRWQTIGRMVVASLLVVSLTLLVVHSHHGPNGEDCRLCYVQKMPGLHGL